MTVTGEPKSKARPRVVGGHAYTPTATRSAEAHVEAAFQLAAPYHRPRPVTTGCEYRVEMAFHCGFRRRRDIDNMTKLVLDALNGVAWADDSQVVEIAARKHAVPKGEGRTDIVIYESE